MKAFVVLACVAIAAARGVDYSTIRQNGLVSPTHLGRYSNDVDLYGQGYGFDTDYYNTWAHHRVGVLSIDQLYSHPLFQQYLHLPLFRQCLEQYPVVLRRYLESPLFQRFWTVPEYQLYWKNPVLYYKYIVPQIQSIVRHYPTTYNYDQYGRDVSVEDYLNHIYGGIDRSYSPYVHTYGRNWPIYNYGRNYYGNNYYGYGQNYGLGQGLGLGQVSGYGYNNILGHRYLLDKIYRTLFVNKPQVGEVTDVVTDVKVAPTEQHVVVDPYTGEKKYVVEPSRIVDVQVDNKIIPQTGIRHQDSVKDEIEKEVLLIRLLKERKINYHIYQILRTLPYYHVKEIVHRIVSGQVSIDGIYNQYNDYNVNYDDITYRHKLNGVVGRLYNNEIVGDKYNQWIRDLYQVVGHRGVPVNQYNNIVY